MHTIAHPLLDMCWAPDLSKTFQVLSQRTSLPIGICLHSQSEWGQTLGDAVTCNDAQGLLVS